jgi:hypothetical protein
VSGIDLAFNMLGPQGALPMSKLMSALTIGNGSRGRRRGKSARRAWCPDAVLSLEDRRLMTVVLYPLYGPEPMTQHGGAELSSVPVFLIFRGSQWTAANEQPYVDATNKLFSSGYLNVLKQYGSDGLAHLAGPIWTNSNAVSDATDGLVQGTIDSAVFGSGAVLPEPNSLPNKPVYVVVTQMAKNSDNPKDTAYNSVYTHHSGFLGLSTQDVPFIWDGCNLASPSGFPSVDAYTKLLSHEMAEIMSDYNNGGYEFAGDQIGDNDGNNYSYRMSNGVLVQPVWSMNDQGWAVYDNNPWTVALDTSNAALFVRGDNAGVSNDTLVVNQDGNNNVTLTFNGQNVNYAINNLRYGFGYTTINVDLKGGTNSFQVQSLNAKSNLLLQNSSPSGSDAVTFGNGTLGNGIRGRVSIADSDADIVVDDSKDTVGRSYKVDGTSLSSSTSGLITFAIGYSGRTGTARSVRINEGTGYDTTEVVNTNAATSVTIDTGAGGNNTYVDATSGPLLITTIKGTDTVTVGSNGNLSAIAGLVTVSNGSGQTDLRVNDGTDTQANQSFGITGNAVTYQGRAVVNYSLIGPGAGSKLTLTEGNAKTIVSVDGTAKNVQTWVDIGSGTNTVNINATSSDFYVLGGNHSQDYVNVGNGSLASIGGLVNVTNSSGTSNVTIDDHADRTARRFVIQSDKVSAQGLPTVNLQGNISMVRVIDGGVPSTFEVDGLPAGQVTLYMNKTDNVTGPAFNKVSRSNKF